MTREPLLGLQEAGWEGGLIGNPEPEDLPVDGKRRLASGPSPTSNPSRGGRPAADAPRGSLRSRAKRGRGFRDEMRFDSMGRGAVALGLTALLCGGLATAAAAEETGASLAPVQPPVIPVGEVSVTAARAERNVLDQPGNITILTREQIVESGVGSVPELLRRQAGIFVTNTNGSNPTGINVETRGFNTGGGNGSRTLVLVDGRRANLPQTGSADWALIPIDDIERIEIVRGPASAVYGDAAMGGVIEIFTRRVSGRAQVKLTGRAGSYGMGQGSLFAGASQGDFSGSVFVNGYTAHGYRERSDFSTTSAKGNLRYTPGDRLVIDFEGGYSSDDRKFPGALTQAEIDSLGRRAADPGTTTDWYDVDDGFAQGRIEWKIADDLLFKLEPTWRKWSQKSDVASIWGNWTQKSKTETTTVNGQFEVDRALGPFASRLVLGGEFLYETDKRGPIGTQSGANDTKNRRSIASAYLQEELQIFDGVLLSGGFRYDAASYRERDDTLALETSEHFDQFSPKAAVTWRPREPFALYFSYSRGLRFPNFDEIYPVWGSRATVLEAERSSSYEIGAKFRDGNLRADLSIYWMEVDDEILYDPLTFQNQNVDEVRHRGIEVSFGYRPRDWVEVYANYTYDQTEIRSFSASPSVVGSRLPITPASRGTVGFNFFIPFRGFDVFELGMNANIVGPRYQANDLANTAPRLPTYATVDLHGRFGKKILDLFNVVLFFQVQNLFGEKYSQFAALDWTGVPGYYPSPGRNFELGLSISVER